MCTTTNETQGVEPEVEPRSLSVLLSLDTYQGMTDAEIDIILDYKIQQALSDAEFTLKATTEIEQMEQTIADNRAGCKRALDMIESLLSREVYIAPSPVAPIVTPTVVEV